MLPAYFFEPTVPEVDLVLRPCVLGLDLLNILVKELCSQFPRPHSPSASPSANGQIADQSRGRPTGEIYGQILLLRQVPRNCTRIDGQLRNVGQDVCI